MKVEHNLNEEPQDFTGFGLGDRILKIKKAVKLTISQCCQVKIRREGPPKEIDSKYNLHKTNMNSKQREIKK